MSTKVEQATRVEHGVQATEAAPSAASAINSPKVSKFAAKAGFVIPKNKLSGSLVPVSRGSKKQEGNDVESDESTKQVHRKTKWSPDLTQDASVRKGRALAYQTRVDQITQLLNSGILGDNEDSPVASQSAGKESSGHEEKSKLLELEKREAIGEILKLNPSYKAPADYKPLLKEAKVPIPIKEYPGYNFIGLIFGPAGDTQKRLEKETGAKIRVYGTKADTKKEVEIKLSDGNETHSGYEELYVHVSAETYEKVDVAVSLIELVVTPVSVNNVAASTASVVISGDNVNSITLSQGTPAPYTFSPVLVNQGLAQPFIGSGEAPPLGQFQPYPTQWFPAGPPPGYITHPFPNSSAPILSNPIQVSSSPTTFSNLPSLFGPRPVLSGGLGSVPLNPSFAPSRPQPVLQRPYMLQAGPPRNISLPPIQSSPGQPNFSAPPPFTTNAPTSCGPNQNMRPSVSSMPPSAPFSFPDRPLTSTGWSQAPAGAPASLGPSHMQPMLRSQGPLPMASQPITVSGGPQLNTTGNIPFWQSASHSPSIAPVQPVGQQPSLPNVTPNPMSGSQQIPSPVTSTSMPPLPPQSGTPVTPSVTALKPLHPSSNDFTFQPHRPQNPSTQVILGPGSQPRPHIMPPHNLTLQPPHSPSFRPGMTSPAASPVMQGFSRPQVSNPMNQPQAQFNMPAPPSTHQSFPGPGPQMGPRHFNPAPQGINAAGPFPPRPGNSMQHQQNYPAMGNRPQNLLASVNQQFSGNISFQPGGPASRPSGPQQIYDPFSPTSVPLRPQLGGNQPNMRKQESDPEYEDLMASVGVK